MSEMSKKAREAMKAKAKRMAGADPSGKVDGSSWTPPEPLNANAKTGLRPVSPRQFKRGGAVKDAAPAKRADRKARASGGGVNAVVNRDVKAANAELGKPHVGGMKAGGRSKKAAGGVPAARMGFEKKAGSPLPVAGAKKGGRIARKSGGKATTVNVVIASKPTDAGQAPPQIQAPVRPPMPPVAAPSPMPMPPMAGGPPPAMPGAGPMPMPRKDGGGVFKAGKQGPYKSYKDMDAGGLSGLGRLEKTEIQERKRGA